MADQPFSHLIHLFSKFPGIGKRQAARFAYFLMDQPIGYIENLTQSMHHLKKHLKQCPESFQSFIDPNPDIVLSPLLRDPTRTMRELMVVVRQQDLDAIENHGVYKGQYFILGNMAPMIDTDMEKHVKIRELESIIKKRGEVTILREVILATPANPEGDYTANIIIGRIKELCKQSGIKISRLGRGLSTGSELEYIDSDTLSSALSSRS